MKNWMTSLIMLAISTSAQAESYFKYGLGIFNSAKDNKVETKTIAIGQSEKWLGALLTQYEGGIWTDSRSDLGRSGSGYFGISVGLDVQAGYIYSQALWGVAGISHIDSMLGGHLQFNNDLGLGIRDCNGYSIGMNYKHISSAGIFTPNQGRDFLMIKMGIPW